ncbi:hypothetical protein CLAC_04435 [Corynebacterium lactis RW2-5]|uniref:Uncharacterized protein n=1 Tax=Corynebacterium lactis RW2-5 TaxID=1408189 RepID=A0A0K2H3H0_9CORY|nr:hypothetical protein CLAC_04435 [Corynebacterium lactis RW2-5]
MVLPSLLLLPLRQAQSLLQVIPTVFQVGHRPNRLPRDDASGLKCFVQQAAVSKHQWIDFFQFRNLDSWQITPPKIGVDRPWPGNRFSVTRSLVHDFQFRLGLRPDLSAEAQAFRRTTRLFSGELRQPTLQLAGWVSSELQK